MQGDNGHQVLMPLRKAADGKALSQHHNWIPTPNGRALQPWEYKTFWIRGMEAPSCQEKSRIERTWRSQSVKGAKAVMLHGRARQRWSCASNMIEETSNMQSFISDSRQMCPLVVLHDSQKLFNMIN